MWIVAVAWMYVVVLMAATEPTVVGGIMTFVFYCALPLSILFYLTGARRRRARRAGQAGRAQRTSTGDGTDSGGNAFDGNDGGGDGGGGD